jgi:hypothetical protein
MKVSEVTKLIYILLTHVEFLKFYVTPNLYTRKDKKATSPPALNAHIAYFVNFVNPCPTFKLPGSEAPSQSYPTDSDVQ